MGIKSRGKTGVAEKEKGGNDLDGEKEVGEGGRRGEEDEGMGCGECEWVGDACCVCVWYGGG